MWKALVAAGSIAVAACSGAAGPGPAPASRLPAAPRFAAPGAVVEPAATGPASWQVDAPPGPSAAVTIDVSEGTWMSLDVSPDGRELVFDLLGDLYVLPIAGGQARAITSGIAWDMQPRFSPDGAWIAFVSDRGGGDNVWVVAREGGEPRQVSAEDHRLVNSPAWSPDGAYLAVRKHFTSTRSLGAGEIWLYHRAGGAGVQLTERANDQKDLGEPAFSPDGRFLYYSHDITPGEVFEYDKDPHAGIYAISRIDLEEQRTERVTGGPGGAVRPTPSPDGRWLAFVRRQGLATALFVRDLDSGEERPIYTELDRDLQETWAIHGVYPQIAWTPDSAAVVAWAGGKLWRIDRDGAGAGGGATEIPFRVEHTRTVTPALRTPVEVAPERFETKMLRWVTVSPDGGRVVYQALGHLYVRELPAGKPRRLTRDDDVFEFYPSISRDGRWVVYTTWHDQRLGDVRVVPLAGGASRVVSRRPGHYVEPTVSPDGRWIAVRRGDGGWLRSPRYGTDPGIYVLPFGGGRARLVSRDGTSPQFAAGSDRLFFVEIARPDGKRQARLRSVGLDRSEPRTHATSENATELVVSPDGRWLAFRERFQAFLTPLPRAGRAVELGPEGKALPLAKVSRDAGEYLHWSGDSRTLYWALGPELYARSLADAFAFIAGGPETPPAPAESGLPIGMTVPTSRPAGKVALVGGRIVTMRGDEVIERGAVVIERDRIAAVGPVDAVAIPADAEVIELDGATVMPGLIDVHAHAAHATLGLMPQRNWEHDAALAFGVTTLHDPSADTAAIFAASELQRAGAVLAPRIFSTGTILYGADGTVHAEVDSLDDARSHLRRMKQVGAFSVKSYNQPRRDQRQQIVAAARELDMMVVPEGGSLFQHNMTMVVDGHTGIEHAIPLATLYADVLQLWSQTEVHYTPTIVVGYGGLWGENYWYQESDVFAHERLTRFVPPFALEPRARRRLHASAGDWNHIAIARHCTALADAGVRINLGAHGQREGLAAHWEIWSLVQGGMEPHRALRAATLDSARYLGLDGDLGSVEVGKLADLIVIDGDPLADIRASERVRHTVLGGRVIDAATVTPRGMTERPPLFWWR